MTYHILFSPTSLSQLKKFEKPVQARIISALERVRVHPERFLTKLVGDPGYKLRVGDYKVICDLEHQKLLILIIKVGHRKKIYKK